MMNQPLSQTFEVSWWEIPSNNLNTHTHTHKTVTVNLLYETIRIYSIQQMGFMFTGPNTNISFLSTTARALSQNTLQVKEEQVNRHCTVDMPINLK